MLVPYMTIYIVAALCAVIGIGCGIAKDKFLARRTLLKAGQFIGIGAAILVLGYSFIVGQRVIVFEGKKPSVTYAKFILFGSTTLDKTSGHDTISGRGGGTWLVNETAGDLVITSASYGTSAFSYGSGDKSETVPPATAHYINEGIDNFGPDDPLPSSISSKSSFETRTQVTW